MISPSDNPALDDRDDFDALISLAMVDVPAVDGLEARILERLSQGSVPEETEAGESDDKPTIAIDPTVEKRVQRRWVLGVATSAAALVVLTAAIVPLLDFSVPPKVQLGAMVDLVESLDFDAESIAKLPDAKTPAVIPSGRWRSDLKNVTPKSFTFAVGEEDVTAHVLSTKLKLKGRGVELVLLSIPQSNVAQISEAKTLADATVAYRDNFATLSWTENGHMYLVASRNATDLELLQDYAFGGAV